MLVAARDMQVKRFIFAASSSTYGDNQDLPKREECIGKPLSPYALTKYVDEMYADVFHKTYGIDYIGLRYFNVFGRRQDPNSMYAAVIPLFIRQLIEHKVPVINGDGTNSRDFTYIDNVVNMNVLALHTENTDALNQIYNTAGGERITIYQMYESIKSCLIEKDFDLENLQPIFGPPRLGDIPHSWADVRKAKSFLGYSPEWTFKEGIQETVNWCVKNYK